MVTYEDMKEFFEKKDFKLIIAADAEPRIHESVGGKIIEKAPAGGVSVAFDPIARASHALYIARGKTEEDKLVVDKTGKVDIAEDDYYQIKRIFLSDEEFNGYYNGFSNQTLWPLCHVTFEQPLFSKEWFEAYRQVNIKFAESIKKEIKGKTFIWVNDYQLALVPHYLNRPRNTIVAMFWHIPWPTWEVFRILPQKKEILEGILACDYIAFHRGYQARNFLKTVERELEARIDAETGRVYHKNHVTTVKNLPMGIDVDVIHELVEQMREKERTVISRMVRKVLKPKEPETEIDALFSQYKVLLGVDRLDYTKGLSIRLDAIDRFFEENVKYRGKVIHLAIVAPSREKIPSYMELKKRVKQRVEEINKKYGKNGWVPIHLVSKTFPRSELLSFYKKAEVCLVTPRDDGMNLVSKEFVLAASSAEDPGMLVLSQFAGSAIDLRSALIVNPYDTEELARAIQIALEMPKSEKKSRMKTMVDALDDKNIYEWGIDFLRSAEIEARENREK